MNDFLTFDTGPSPKIRIASAYARLTLVGWDQPRVQVSPTSNRSDLEKDFQGVQEDGLLTLTTRQPVLVQVPAGSQVVVASAYGEALFQGILGGLVIEHAYGKLQLKDLGPVEIKEANGSVNVAAIQAALPTQDDALQINRVTGTLSVADLQGGLSAQSIGGNLNLKDLQGSLAASVLGNATLELDPQPGLSYRLTAHGNLFCRVPASLNATVRLESHGPALVKVGSTVRKLDPGTQELVFGDGSASLHLVAYGTLNLFDDAVREASSPGFDFDALRGDFVEGADLDLNGLASEITRQVSEQLQSQLDMLDVQLEQALSSLEGVSPEKAERMAERAREKAERAREKIQAAAERAQEKMNRKLEEAQRKMEREAERGRRRVAFEWSFKSNRPVPPRPVPPIPPAPPRPAPRADALEAEKLVILQMLADKKITAEEADRLLSALE